jgi:hypothetical protein
MSLVIVICAEADFVESAWLVAVTWTTTGDGKSAGAVYTPAAVIVPEDALPPGMLFTLQVTLVSVVFVTVAVRVCEFPSRTDPLSGVTDTLMAGGGGGGDVTVPAPPAAHPCIHTHVARSARDGKRA